ncbi:hypothetical protein R6Q59_014932 [Mikania micrantha]
MIAASPPPQSQPSTSPPSSPSAVVQIDRCEAAVVVERRLNHGRSTSPSTSAAKGGDPWRLNRLWGWRRERWRDNYSKGNDGSRQREQWGDDLLFIFSIQMLPSIQTFVQAYKDTLSLPKVKTLTKQFPSPTAAAVAVTTAAESLHHSVLIILRHSPPHQLTRSDLAPPPTAEPIVTDLAPPPTAAPTGSASSRRPPPSASSVLIIDHDFVLDAGSGGRGTLPGGSRGAGWRCFRYAPPNDESPLVPRLRRCGQPCNIPYFYATMELISAP